MKKKKCINNIHAEVPIVILVIGVLLLCIIIAVAGFSSIFKGKDRQGSLGEIVESEACLSYIEQYRFYEKLGYPIEEVKALPMFKSLPNFEEMIKNENGNYFLLCDSEGLKIKYSLK